MAKRAIIFLILAGCECDGSLLASIEGRPEGIHQIGTGPEFCTQEVIDTVKSLSPCPVLMDGHIVWRPAVFDCSLGQKVWGCMGIKPCGDFNVQVVTSKYAYDTALGEELGHYIFIKCGKDNREWYPAPGEICPDGNTRYCRSLEWSKWIQDVRTVSRERCQSVLQPK